MRHDDAEYYRRRALQEQLAAQTAACAAARQRHDELAAMYGFRVAILTTHPGLRLEESRTMVKVSAE